MQSTGQLLRHRLAAALTDPGRRPAGRGARSDHAAGGHTGPARRQVPALLVVDRRFKLRLYNHLKLAKTYTVAVGQVGLETPPGSTTCRTRRSTRLARPEQRVGGRPGGQGIPGDVRTTRSRRAGSASQRRGHPRHRPDRLARQRGLARLHPDGDPGRDRALRRGARRRPRLHRLRAADCRSLDRNLLPALLLQRGLAPVCRKQSVPMKTPPPLAQHRVPHRRSVAGPWIGCQGATGLSSSSTRPASSSWRGWHPAVLGVDEEPTSTSKGSWAPTLRRFDGWLRPRGMAEKTRRAYGVDLGQLGEWPPSRDLRPAELGHRDLRRFAGVLSERGMSKAAVARKLAAVRTFYRHLIELGEVERQPGRPRVEPQAGPVPAACAEARRGGRGARAHPGHDAARAARPRDVRARLRRRPAR